MNLALRDPISSIKDLNENMPIIEHNLNPIDKSLIKHIREEIEKELTLEQIDHDKTGGSHYDFAGLSTERIEEIIGDILTTKDAPHVKNIDNAYNSRGEAKLQLGEYESAFSDFSKANKIRDFSGIHRKNMGIAKFHLKQFKEAIDYFNEALSTTFIDTSEIYYYRGLANYQLEQHLDAIADFDKALDEANIVIDNFDRTSDYFIHKIKEIKRFVVARLPENERIILWRNQTILDLHGHLCVCGSPAGVVHDKFPHHSADIYERPLSHFAALCKTCCDYLKGKNSDGFNKFSNISSIPEGEVYDHYLNSASWKTKQKIVLERDGNQCICGKEALHVHHKTYERLKMTLNSKEEPVFIGEELLSDLVALCKSCHDEIHGR